MLTDPSVAIVSWNSERYLDDERKGSFESALFHWKEASAYETRELSVIYLRCTLKCGFGPWSSGHTWEHIVIDWNQQKIVFYNPKEQFTGRLFWGIRHAWPKDTKREIEKGEPFVPKWNSSNANPIINFSAEDTTFEHDLFLFKNYAPHQQLAHSRMYRPRSQLDRDLKKCTPIEMDYLSNKMINEDDTLPIMGLKYLNAKLVADMGCFCARQKLDRIYLDWNICRIQFCLEEDDGQEIETVTGDLIWGFHGKISSSLR